MNRLFGGGKGKKTVDGSSSSRGSKHAREDISLNVEVNEEYKKQCGCTVEPTRWRCDSVLNQNCLAANFDWMANNAGMCVFAQLHTLTYKEITHEILATFEDNLEVEGVEHACTFTIGGRYFRLTLQALCEMFGFVNAGASRPHDELLADASDTWQIISVNQDVNYTKAKVPPSKTWPSATSPYSLSILFLGVRMLGAWQPRR